MVPLLVMGGLTAAKMLSDADKEERSKKLQAETERYSPWTGNKGRGVEYADPAGTIAQGTAGYFGMQQGMENQEMMKKLVDAQIASGKPMNMNMHGFMGPEQAPRSYNLDEDPSQQGMALGQGDYWNQRLNSPYGMVRSRRPY